MGLFGPAVDLLEWMGVLPAVQAARTQTRVISLVRSGRRPIEVSAEALSEGVSERHIEMMRGDLARIIYQLTREQVEYIFDDSIAAVTEDGSGVHVIFERGRAEHYDVVLGADGLHSITRYLVFGPERRMITPTASSAKIA